MIYIAGYDTKLDLTGGEVVVYYNDNSMEVSSMNEAAINITHNIDFSISGVYIVELKGNDNSDTFAIQVVDADYIEHFLSGE